jgi:hypothetical protein
MDNRPYLLPLDHEYTRARRLPPYPALAKLGRGFLVHVTFGCPNSTVSFQQSQSLLDLLAAINLQAAVYNITFCDLVMTAPLFFLGTLAETSKYLTTNLETHPLAPSQSSSHDKHAVSVNLMLRFSLRFRLPMIPTPQEKVFWER